MNLGRLARHILARRAKVLDALLAKAKTRGRPKTTVQLATLAIIYLGRVVRHFHAALAVTVQDVTLARNQNRGRPTTIVQPATVATIHLPGLAKHILAGLTPALDARLAETYATGRETTNAQAATLAINRRHLGQLARPILAAKAAAPIAKLAKTQP